MIAREVCPEIDIHISTQANNVNYMTFLFWQEQGAARVVTGRELSLEEIRQIRDHIPDSLEIETLSTAPCASLILEDVCSAISSPEEMPIRELVPIPAVGNIPL